MEKEVTLADILDEFDGKTIDEAIALLERIKERYSDEGTLSFSLENRLDEYAQLWVMGTREETEAERLFREEKQAIREKTLRDIKLRQLEQLKKELGLE